MFITVIQTTATEFILSRYQARRGTLTFLKGVRQQLDSEEGTVSDILAAWKDECAGDRIILALPPAGIAMRELTLPISDRKKAREIMPLELKGEMASDADEPVFDALPLSGGRSAAIWGGQKQLAEEIAACAGSGFEPEIVTTAMFSWHRVLPKDGAATMAITDGEAVAVYVAGQPLFFRALPKGGERPLDATIAAIELAREISIEQIFTIGPARLETSLELTPLPIAGALLSTFAGDSNAAADLAPHFAMAEELLLGEPVNLRRGALKYTRQTARLRRKLRLTYALAAALVILIFAEAGLRYYLVRRDVASLDTSIRSIYKEVFPTRAKAVDEVSELKAEIKRLGASGSEGVLVLLTKLAQAKGDEARELYEVDFDGNQITGRGYDRSAQSVTDFKTKAGALFASFEVSEIKSRPDGSVSFAFRGALKGGGK
ncbi:MAG: general secretion pathway protein GspL [Geobacter sp.]|nr:general secretion pathway protein GspL [Geobacter sp.]